MDDDAANPRYLVVRAMRTAYGFALGSPVLVVPKSMASVVGAVAIIVSWRYRTAPGDLSRSP